MVHLDSLAIGACIRLDMRVAVMELDHLVRRLGHFDGILGLDVLSQDGFCLDFVRNRLSLAPDTRPHSACRRAACEIRVDVMKAGLIEVPVSSLDRVPLPAILDTGAAQTLANSRALAVLGGSVEAGETDGKAMGADSRAVTARRAKIPGLRIADITVPRIVIAVADLPVFWSLGFGEGPVLLLGLDIFIGRVLTLDFREGRAFLTDPCTQSR